MLLPYHLFPYSITHNKFTGSPRLQRDGGWLDWSRDTVQESWRKQGRGAEGTEESSVTEIFTVQEAAREPALLCGWFCLEGMLHHALNIQGRLPVVSFACGEKYNQFEE